MNDDSVVNDARVIWQSQPITLPIALEQCVLKFERLQRRRRRAALVLTAGCLGLAVPFAFMLAEIHSYLERIGMLLMFIGIGYLVRQLHDFWLNAPDRRVPGMGGGLDRASVDHYRSELERLRDFSRGGIFWSRYAMLIPGYLAFFTGLAIANPQLTAPKVTLAIAILASVAAIPLNLGGARRLQKKIDEINRILRENE